MRLSDRELQALDYLIAEENHGDTRAGLARLIVLNCLGDAGLLR